MKSQLESYFKLIALFLISCLGLLFISNWALPDGRFHAYFLDIGQGDAVLIQTPSQYNIMVDGGPGRGVLAQVGKRLPFWDKKIDLLVATNPDKDHIAGLNFILESYQVSQIWLPKIAQETETFSQLVQNIQKYQVEETAVVTGDKLSLEDGVTMQVLWPKTATPRVPTINEGSIVFLLEYGELSMLFTGDAEATTQPYPDLNKEIDVLKVPHHGSKGGMSTPYLETLSPQLAVISAGKKNPYGHPDPGTVSDLEKAGSQVLTTSDKGTIEVVSDGKSWYTRTER